MSQLIERLREAHDNFAGLEGVSNDDLVAVLDAAAALTQPPSPVAAGETIAAVEFTRWAISEGPWRGYDLDGGAMQDKAEALGIIQPEPFDPKVHGENDDLEKGDPYYSFTPAFRAMLSVRPPIGETVPGAGWRPIETAPRNGERLLLWDGFSVFEGMWNGFWCQAQTFSTRPWTKAWMPVPAPPLAPTQEGEAP